jgi:transcriptional regulator with XRE-family HTH domain
MTPKQIGATIRKARGTRSVREVAIAAGITRQQVTDIETASTNYTRESLWALAKAVGVTIEAIIEP